mgnify:CR=1 FL=1
MSAGDKTEGLAGSEQRSRDIVAVIGSTGTGKSQLAVELAKAAQQHQFCGIEDAEIISADSMQVYRGLDVITNKVTDEEMRGVKHHLIDFLEPGQKYTVGAFGRDAGQIVRSTNDIRYGGPLSLTFSPSGRTDAITNALKAFHHRGGHNVLHSAFSASGPPPLCRLAGFGCAELRRSSKQAS